VLAKRFQLFHEATAAAINTLPDAVSESRAASATSNIKLWSWLSWSFLPRLIVDRGKAAGDLSTSSKLDAALSS
jgi:hypothetical protein